MDYILSVVGGMDVTTQIWTIWGLIIVIGGSMVYKAVTR